MIDGWIWMDRSMDGWIDRWMDDRSMDRWMDDRWIDGLMNGHRQNDMNIWMDREREIDEMEMDL